MKKVLIALPTKNEVYQSTEKLGGAPMRDENKTRRLPAILLIFFVILFISSHAYASNNIIFHGYIVGSFDGYEGGNVYELNNGTYWIQMEDYEEYGYSYNPNAVIINYNGTLFISVKGAHKAVHVIPAMMVSRLSDTFDGWDGDTILELDNGSIWRQAEYYYRYYYKYRPKVYIAEYGREILALVEGLRVLVPVERIN